MATKIILKKSSVAGAVPLPADLEQGEVAINLADRRLFVKNNSDVVVQIGGAYIGATAPTAPYEGALWYDTTNDELKTYDGTVWSSGSGAATALSALTDTTITSPASGEVLLWNGTAWVNNTLAEAGIQPAGAYLTAEVDTLDTVTGRGASTANVLTVGGMTVTGDLTVNGTTTAINSNEVNIGDAIILLNSDEVGAPSQNAGIEIERGTDVNKSFLWDETADAWTLGDETLQGVVLDGGTY